MSFKPVSLLTALLFVSGPAMAQTAAQTPENAKKFLSLTLSTVELNTEGNFSGWMRLRLSVATPTTDVCSIRLIGNGERNAMNRTGTKYFNSAEVPIDFRRVTDISPGGTTVHVAYNIGIAGNGVNKLIFVLPSADLAKRVEYAMVFLKSHCNPADQTGF